MAKIERLSLKTREVWLSGSDLLDGTPILDIKPYVPIYDCPDVRNDGPARAAAFSDHTTFITRPVDYVRPARSGRAHTRTLALAHVLPFSLSFSCVLGSLALSASVSRESVRTFSDTVGTVAGLLS